MNQTMFGIRTLLCQTFLGVWSLQSLCVQRYQCLHRGAWRESIHPAARASLASFSLGITSLHQEAAGDGSRFAPMATPPRDACRGVPLSTVHLRTFLHPTLLTAKSSPGAAEEWKRPWRTESAFRLPSPPDNPIAQEKKGLEGEGRIQMFTKCIKTLSQKSTCFRLSP